MKPLDQLPNIGAELTKRLNQVGVNSPEDLIRKGTEDIFIKLKAIDPGACINELYAIEGAIQGIRWHNIDELRKQELLDFFRRL